MVSWLLAWWPVPASFASMYCQDVLCVWLVQAEAARQAHRAARWDLAQDACRFAGQAAGLGTVLLGHDLAVKAAVVAATLAADYCGTYTGVRLGQRAEERRKPR